MPEKKDSADLIHKIRSPLGWLVSPLKRLLSLKMTIVVMPSSRGTARTFEFSYLIFALIICVFTATVFTALSVPTLWESDRNTWKIEREAYLAETKSSQQILREARALDEVVHDLNLGAGTLDSILQISGTHTKWGGGMGGPLSEGESGNNLELGDEGHILGNDVNNLKDSVRSLRSIDHFLKGLGNYVGAYAQQMKKIPSIHPLLGRGFTVSPFGYRIDPIERDYRFHNGVDIGEMPGTPIRATSDGVVRYAKAAGAAGLYVMIEHAYGFSSHYMHLQVIRTQRGQSVKRGEIIGLLGSTGRSTGPHLHYEVRVNGKSIDPEPYIGLDRANPHFID